MLTAQALEQFTPRLAATGMMFSYHSDPWDHNSQFESVTIMNREPHIALSPALWTVQGIATWLDIIEHINKEG